MKSFSPFHKMLILWIFLNTWRFQGCKIWSLGSNLSMVDVIAFVMLKVSICSLWKLKRTASFCGFVIPVCVFVLTWWAKVKCRYKNQEALRQCIRRWFSSDAVGRRILALNPLLFMSCFQDLQPPYGFPPAEERGQHTKGNMA